MHGLFTTFVIFIQNLLAVTAITQCISSERSVYLSVLTELFRGGLELSGHFATASVRTLSAFVSAALVSGCSLDVNMLIYTIIKNEWEFLRQLRAPK